MRTREEVDRAIAELEPVARALYRQDSADLSARLAEVMILLEALHWMRGEDNRRDGFAYFLEKLRDVNAMCPAYSVQ